MLSIIIGLITVLIGVLGMAKSWGQNTGWQLFLTFLASVVPACLILGGVLGIIAGMSSMKDKSAGQTTDKKTEENKS